MKIAIAGTGRVATSNYLPVLSSHGHHEFGLWNRSASKAEEARVAFGGRVFDDLASMAAWCPDLAFVLTSETCHHLVGAELIAGGVKRIFFEKPLVAQKGQAHVSEEDFVVAKELLNLATARDCETAMMFNYRYFDQSLRAVRIASERNFGRVVNATGLVHYACWSHCIDLIRSLSGDYAEVSALAGQIEHEGQGILARDVAAAFTFATGGTGTLIGTSALAWEHPLLELTFTFERGRMQMRDLDGEMEVLAAGGRVHERIMPVRDGSRWNHYGDSFRKALQAYLEAVSAGLPPPVSGRDGLAELAFEAALRRSVRDRRPVSMAEFPF